MMPITHRLPAVCLLFALALTGCAATPGADQGADAAATADETEAAGQQQSTTEPESRQAPQSETDNASETATADEPQQDAPTAETPGQPDTAAPEGLSGRNLYRLLVADLAGRRGNVEMALKGYLATSRDTGDPRVAERATRLALYADRPESALKAARRWVSLAPDSQEAHAILARMYLRSGSVEAALGQLRAVIAGTDGGAASGLRQAVQLLSKSERPESALQAAASLAEAYPDVAAAHYAVAKFSHQAGSSERALTAVERALGLKADYTDARLLRARILVDAGRADEAFAGLRQAGARQPDNRQLMLGHIRLLDAAGRSEAAVAAMQRAFERFGDDPKAVYMLALLAIQTETWNDAQIYLERLLAMESRTATAHYYLGRIAQRSDDYTGALKHYIKVGRGEYKLDASRRAAVCLAHLGRMGEARQRVERLRAQYRERQPRIKVVLTQVEVERAGGEFRRALKVLGDAIEAYPEASQLRYQRSLIAAQLERFELARGDLEWILEREPDNGRALNALGYMLADRGLELERARAMIERALEQTPEQAATLDSMGWVLYKQGHAQEAIKYLRKAWSARAGAEIGAHLGEVLWSRGRRDAARGIWEQAEEIAPDNKVLQETRERLQP